MKLLRSLPFLSVFLLTFCVPQKSEEQNFWTSQISPESFLEAFKRMQQGPALKHATIGIYVCDAQTKQPIVDYQSHLSLATGSTMKVITTATALDLLGSDFRFETSLAHGGEVKKNTLHGNIYIQGGGDPTLQADSVMDLWVSAIERLGIQKIEGNIIGDASIFEPDLVPRTWIWEDIGNYYGAGACGLSINENSYKLYYKSGKPGALAQLLRMEPTVPGLTFTTELQAGEEGSGDKGYIFGAPFTYQRVVRGTIPPNKNNYDIKGALPDPAKFCAQLLLKALQKKGIAVGGEAQGIYSREAGVKDRKILFSHQSRRLQDIVEETNTKSVNIFAEAMFKMIGLRKKGEGSAAAGAKAIMEYWESKGLDMEGFQMEDGSGLSRFNAITPKQMSEILSGLTESPIFEDFYASLAVAGETGTMKGMCKNGAAKGRVHAKSGYINRVRCYTGYADNTKGRKIAFSIFVNNFSGEYKTLTPAFEELLNLMAQLEP